MLCLKSEPRGLGDRAAQIINGRTCCIGSNSPNRSQRQAAIRAELRGSDEATALGITARWPSPVLALCRKLIEGGCDPERPMDVYRGDTVCLHVRSIGEAAGLEVGPRGTGFVARPEGRRRPWVRDLQRGRS